MIKKTSHPTATGLLLGLFISLPSVAMDEIPLISVAVSDKLKNTRLSLVYDHPHTSLNRYSKVWLMDASVAFRKNWLRDQNYPNAFKVKPRDMERIKTSVAGLFKEVFSKQFTNGGYTLVEKAGDDVLIVRPAIVNLDIIAPDSYTPTRILQFAESAGQMTLFLEFSDSMSGEIYARAIDSKIDRGHTFQLKNRVINRAAANRMLNSWARTLAKELEEARVVASES